MVWLRSTNFKPFVAFYVVAQAIAFLYVAYMGREFIFSKMLPFKETFVEAKNNILIGINLTISNIVSSLILGIGRAMVDGTEGIESFGLLSLSVTLTNFFLQFIAQASMVMFPAIRQLNEESMKRIYLKLRSGISYVLCFILVLYVPLKITLSWWLPQYTESLRYLAYLLPICIFDGKMQLLFNTFLKVLRKERAMLQINLIVLGISTILCAIGAFIIKDIIAVSIAMLLAIVLRSIITNAYLSKVMVTKFDKNLIWEFGLSFSFIVLNAYVNNYLAFLIYGIMYVLYLIDNRAEIKVIFKKDGKKQTIS